MKKYQWSLQSILQIIVKAPENLTRLLYGHQFLTGITVY